MLCSLWYTGFLWYAGFVGEVVGAPFVPAAVKNGDVVPAHEPGVDECFAATPAGAAVE